MEIDVNVRFGFTPDAKEFIQETLSGLALLKAMKPAKLTLEKPKQEGAPAKLTVEVPKKESRPEAKQEAAPAAKAEPPKKAEPEENPNAKVSGDKLLALREVIGKVTTENPDNRDKLKEWLNAHELKKVPDCTFAQADELMAYIGTLEG